MKRVQLAKQQYRMSVSGFRNDITRLLYRVDAGEAFVITRREASAEGWQEEDIAVVVPLHTTAKDFEQLQEQIREDAEKLKALAAEEAEREGEEPAERVRSGVRVVGRVEDAKRGRRQHG
jgi:antitoxin (DNA-binding transcriptional repressor) of toxin-antitoxin stability system